MSYEDRMDVTKLWTATDILDLFLTLDLSDQQCLEMIEALIQKVNTNGSKFKLVEVD